MNQIDRAEAYRLLATLAEHYPHWRIGQLIANVAGWADADIWDIEDADLVVAAKNHLESLIANRADRPSELATTISSSRSLGDPVDR